MNQEIPIIVPRYAPEDWPAWKELSQDPMCDSWEEWNEGIEDFFLEAAKNRAIVHAVTIRPGAFREWAEKNHKRFDGHSRAEFAGLKIKDRFLRPYEEPAEFPKQAEVNRHLRNAIKSHPDISLSDTNDSYLRRPQAGVCPLFRESRDGEPEHFGSGVLIKIGDEHFLASAAHVFDEFKIHPILIPGLDGLTEVTGGYKVTPLPASGSRDDDTVDIGYLHFKNGAEASLNSSCIFLDEGDLNAMDEVADGDVYTAIGYRAELSESSDGVATTELSRIGCAGVNDHRYKKLGLSPISHLLLQYRMSKGVNYKTMNQGQKLDFSGMSGGGAFAWSKDLPNPHALAQPLLVGILTTYSPYHNVFLVTRLGVLLAGILKDFPNLPIYRKPR